MSKRKGKKIPVTDPSGEGEPDAVESSADQAASTDPKCRDAEDASDTQTEGDSVEALTRKVESLEDALLRAKAETLNVQRRASNEKSQAIRFANAELMKALLPVLDDFDRSLQATTQAGHDVEGVRLVHDNLFRALAGHGLSRIEALHEPFDPNVHEAMLQQPNDEHAEGTVLEEIARGYKLHDRVIRPARVIVSKAVEHESAVDAKEE